MATDVHFERYFNGLLFLTTNRVDDIDEAIVSRCIAMIKYHPPQADDRRRIWQVMASQFQLALDGALIEELVMCFPQASGRDIKGLAKLVAKFCQHKQLSPPWRYSSAAPAFAAWMSNR